MEFKSIEECEAEEKDGKDPLHDPNLLISDFEKMDNKRMLHYIYKATLIVVNSGNSYYYEDELIKAAESVYEKAKELVP